MAPFLIFAILSVFSITCNSAENRAHGLENESPIAFSPEAVAFFHPDSLQPSANGPTLPLAATMESNPAHESIAGTGPAYRKGIGASSIIGIPLGFTFVCVIAMGVYYVVLKRRANLQRANQKNLTLTA